MTHLPPIKIDQRKEKPEEERNTHTNTQAWTCLHSFFLVIRLWNMETDSRSILKVTLAHTHTWIFYRPECYPFIPRGHTHTDLTKKATVYLTTASFSSLKKKFQTKARKKKKRIISRYDLSLSMYMCVCWPMPQPTAAHYWFPHSEEKKEMIRERIQ